MKYIHNKEYTLEVCANSLKSAIIAQEGGANRIELCSNIESGGITPSKGLIETVKEQVLIDLFVLIRPRGGNFVYEKSEFEIIKKDIIECGKIGCQGVVVGILTKNGEIDKDRNRELADIAKECRIEITFHRAIDRTRNILKATEEIIKLGFDRILTSGGYPSSQQGIYNILKMCELYSDRINIMPGSSITPENIKEIAIATKAKEFHGTFSSKIADMDTYANPQMNEENYIIETNLSKVQQARSILDSLDRE